MVSLISDYLPQCWPFQPWEGNSRSNPNSIWTPLRGAEDTRVLKLSPGRDEEPLACTLEVISLAGRHRPFEALSYTWGSLDRVCNITCNGVEHGIARNLHSALIRLRDTHAVRVLWCDALSIDQADGPQARSEREAQVRMMWKIFSHASKVIADLGEAVDQQDQFDALLQKFRSLPPDMRATSDMSLLAAGDFDLPDLQDTVWLSLIQVLSREYFTRVWIIQECVLATRLEFLLGQTYYADDLIDVMLDARLYACFMAKNLTFVSNIRRVVEEGIQDLEPQFRNMVAIFGDPSLSYFASDIDQLRIMWRGSDRPEVKLLRQRLVFRKILGCANHKATDIRDRIYSFVGLLRRNDLPLLEVNYSQTDTEVAQNAARYLVMNDVGSLILYRCVHCRRDGPSWMANIWEPTNDWLDGLIDNADASCELFNACGTTNFRMVADKDGVCMLTDAALIDRVVDMSPPNTTLTQAFFATTGPTTDVMECLVVVNDWIEHATKTSEFPVEALNLWRTTTADMKTRLQRNDNITYLPAVIEGALALAKVRAAMFAEQRSRYDLVSNMNKGVDFLRMSGSGLEGFWDQIGMDPDLFPDFSSEDTQVLIELFLEVFSACAWGRRLGLMEFGIPALLPGDTQLDDYLAIVLGAPIPLVLRPVGDGYRIVGSCYIHGLMDGQLVDSALWWPREIKLY